jgi:hypothetical protein
VNGDEGHRERSWSALERRFPEVWRQLAAIGSPSAVPVLDGGRMVNLDLGDGLLYPQPGPEWGRRQATAFLSGPPAVTVPDPAGARPSHVIRDFLPRLDGWLADRRIPSVGTMAVRPGFAFVLGVGLGFHLPDLVSRDAARHLVLVEPVPELLLRSLDAVDWESLLAETERRDISLHWLVGLDPEATTRAIEALLIRTRGGPFLDGARIGVFYPSWANRRVRDLLDQRLGNFLVRPNALDDEILMMRNAYANLAGSAFLHLGFDPRPRQDIPAFVVGSGPSLDRDLPAIEALRSRALVISCGSALGILLDRGIRPDFHVENENSPPLVRNLETFRDEHGLRGIRLLASVTVEARAAALFDERWFYHRALSSPSGLLNDGTPPLPFTGPLAANAGLAAALAMGLHRLYLFGVDCGRRPGSGHHAQGAIYNRPGYDNFIPGEGQEMLNEELSLLVPGNFGGSVESSPYMDLSRRTISELLRRGAATCVNCSDGALIDGAKAVAARSLRLDGPAGRQTEVIAAIAGSLNRHAAGTFLDRVPLDRHRAACGAFIDAWPRVVADTDDLWALDLRMNLFQDQYRGVLDGIWKMVGGSLSLMLRLAAWREARIPDADRRREFRAFFREAFVDGGREAVASVRELLETIAAAEAPEAIGDRFAERFPLSRYE